MPDTEEKIEEEKSSEEGEEKEEKSPEEEVDSEKGDGFEKKEEYVPAGKYNQSIRKAQELEIEKRELQKKLAEAEKAEKPAEKSDKEEEEDDVEDFFGDEEEKPKKPKKKDLEPELDSILEKKLKPLEDKIARREKDDERNQRDAFFKTHPEYTDSRKFNELLDELDNSINPNSKDNHYTQLEKAHRILTGGKPMTNKEIEDAKRKMASEMSPKGDGASKSEGKKSVVDERAERLAKQMPIGYVFKK